MQVFLVFIILSLLNSHVIGTVSSVEREDNKCPVVPNASVTDTSRIQSANATMWKEMEWPSRSTYKFIAEEIANFRSLLAFVQALLSYKNCHHVFTFLLLLYGVLYSFCLFAKLSYVLGSAASEFFVEPQQERQPKQPEQDTTPDEVRVFKAKPRPKKEQMPKKKRKKRPHRRNKNKKP